MGQFPPPGDPIGYYSTPPSRRPTSVTVFAVLAIVFGSLGTLAMLCSIPQYFGFSLMRNTVTEAMRDDILVLSVNVATHVLALGLFITLLWSGIGALSLKPAARTAMIWYAWIDIITSVIQIILNIAILHTRTEPMARKALLASPGINPANVESILKLSYYGGTAFAVVILIWPILILYYMNRPHVKAAFSGNTALPPVGYYPQ